MAVMLHEAEVAEAVGVVEVPVPLSVPQQVLLHPQRALWLPGLSSWSRGLLLWRVLRRALPHLMRERIFLFGECRIGGGISCNNQTWCSHLTLGKVR